MKKFFNYLFLFIFVVYLLLLFSRIGLEKVPRNTFSFCLIYFIFIGTPITLQFSLVYLLKNKEFFLKFFKSPEEKPTLFKKISTKGILIFKNFLEKTNNFVYHQFLFTFLEKKKPFGIFFYFLTNSFEKIANSSTIIIFLLIRLPWFIFLASFFYEILTNNFFYFSLYLFSLNFLIKTLLKIYLFIVAAFILKPANTEFILYFLEFMADNKLYRFFLNNTAIRDSLFFDINRDPNLINKRMISEIWNSFVKIFHFTILKLKVDQLLYMILQENKYQRIINLIIFGSFSLMHLAKFLGLFQELIIALISLAMISLITFFCFIYYSSFLNKEHREVSHKMLFSNENYIFNQNAWFQNTKKKLLNKHEFLSDLDLAYPFNNNCTATDFFYQEQEFNLTRQKDPSALVNTLDYLNLSYYKFSLEEKLLLDKTIDLFVFWFNYSLEKGFINLETYIIDYESKSKPI